MEAPVAATPAGERRDTDLWVGKVLAAVREKVGNPPAMRALGFGASTVTTPLPLQAGVYWHEPSPTDLFFITLQKTEKDYSPTTRYRDYAISDGLFHWESQSTTASASAMGQRYINHEANGTNVVLFIRSSRTEANDRTRPHFCAGRARYVEHRSERPMQITCC